MKQILLIILILLGISGDLAYCDEPDSDVREFLAKAKVLYAEAMTQKKLLTEQIKAMEAGRINKTLEKNYVVTGKRFVWKDAETKESTIQGFKQRLASLDRDESILPILDYPSLRVGQIGKLPDNVITKTNQSSSYKVLQIIDNNNALIEWNIWSDGTNSNSPPSKVSKVFWLKNDMTGKVDGQTFTLSGCYRVIGTKQYETTTGSNTVFQFESFDPSDLLSEIRNEPKSKSDLKKLFREWSDATGSFKVKAKFIELQQGVAVLEKEDGKRISVPLTKLSKDDLAWIQDHK